MLCKGVKITSVKLITIDGSTKKTGIACFRDGKYENHYLLDYSKDKNMENRFEEMTKGIWKILDSYNPNIIYIEETYMANDPKTMRILTRLQGVVYAWCINHGCEFNTIRPTEWRKWLKFNQGKNVKRKELKEQSIHYIKENYNLDVIDDEADAICIADAVMKIYEKKGIE